MDSKYAIYETFWVVGVSGLPRTVYAIFLDHPRLEQQDYIFVGQGGCDEARLLVIKDDPGVEAASPRPKIFKGYLTEQNRPNFQAFCSAYFIVFKHDDDKAYVQGALERAAQEGLLDPNP